MPQHHMVIPHYMGKSKEIDVQDKKQDSTPKDIKRQDSFSSRSSYQDIPLLLPQEPDGLSVVNSKVNGDMNHNHLDHPSRTSHSSSFSFRKAKGEQSVPDMQMKAFVDDLGSPQAQSEAQSDVIAQSTADKEWWEAQERGDHVASIDEAGQVGPRTPCRCQVGICHDFLKKSTEGNI